MVLDLAEADLLWAWKEALIGINTKFRQQVATKSKSRDFYRIKT